MLKNNKIKTKTGTKSKIDYLRQTHIRINLSSKEKCGLAFS